MDGMNAGRPPSQSRRGVGRPKSDDDFSGYRHCDRVTCVRRPSYGVTCCSEMNQVFFFDSPPRPRHNQNKTFG